MVLVWICLAIMMSLQKIVRRETSLNGFVDLYLRSVFFFLFSCLDFSRHVMTSSPTLSMFNLDHYVRWSYMCKISFLALAFGFIVLSVNNASCLTVTAAPMMLPAIITASDKIPRILWIAMVVISFVGVGLISKGDDYTPADKKIGTTINNNKAFFQSIAAVVCYLVGTLISSRNEKIQRFRMHYAVDAVYVSIFMTLWMPGFFFGDFSFNDGPLALTW